MKGFQYYFSLPFSAPSFTLTYRVRAAAYFFEADNTLHIHSIPKRFETRRLAYSLLAILKPEA